MVHKLKLIFTDENLRKRILFVLGALFVFRLLAAIPIPGVDAAALARFFSDNNVLGLLDIFSGGGLSNLSIVMIGVAPYITASIIMQLLTIMVPRLKELYSEEGEAGRKKFMRYSRWLTLPLAVVQSFGFLLLLSGQGILPQLTAFELLSNVLVITAGSILIMWIGELISEFGIGNGISLIIFAGIIASMPSTVVRLWEQIQTNPQDIPLFLGVGFLSLLLIAGVVAVTEAERPIPVTYAKRVRGNKMYGGASTYLPLRVNQAGVMPIIFALSLLLLPNMVFSFLTQVSYDLISTTAQFLSTLFANPWFFATFYFILVFLFTYFYTAVTFDPSNIAKGLQRGGAFIPGVRPGDSTTEHIGKILNRITFLGATFLGVVAVIPLVLQGYTGNSAFAIGGTALLIVVSVVLDLVKKIEAQVSMREY